MPTFYGAIDLAKNELRNAVVQNLGTAPAAPVKGQVYFDSTANILYWWNGTVWVAAQSGASLSPAVSVTGSAVADAGVVGVNTNYARQDHVHAREGFGAITAQTTFGAAASNGSATSVTRSDHTHGTPTHDASAHSSLLGNVSPETAFSMASNNGSATTISRSDHLHGTPAHDGSAHSTVPLNFLAAPQGSVTMGGYTLINVGAPVNGNDAANKTYVDNLTAGLSWKEAVRVASPTATNFGVLSGLLTVDGVTVSAGDRVLIKDQTTASSNGIYVAAAGAWARATDADSAGEIEGMAVFVMEGTTQGDSAWVCTTNAPITVGTTSLAFTQFAGGGAVTAGTGMTQAGNVINVIAGDSSLTVTADELHVNTGVIASVASLSSYVPTARTVTAGNGLTGGGDLSANRTLDVVAGDTSLTVAADSIIVNTSVIATVASVTAAVGAKAGKYAAALAGTVSPEVVTHNLNTRDIQLTVLNGGSPYTAVEVDWDATTVNTATVRYNPNLGAGYRVVVVG